MRSIVHIGRPPEEIADVLLDPTKAPMWTTDLERFEVVSEKPGLVGSRARLHYVAGGRRYVMEEVLLEVERNRRFLSRVSGDAIEAEVETRLVPTESGTRVEVSWTGYGKPLLLRLLLPFMRGGIARQAEGDLRKLKELVGSL